VQFKSKRTRSRRSSQASNVLSGNFDRKTTIDLNGTAYVMRDRKLDLCVDNTKVGEAQFKVGQRTFPAYYGHKRGFIGETMDAKRSGDGSQWLVFLTGVLRDKNGEPILSDGEPVQIDGWYRECDLVTLGGVGSKVITPGHSEQATQWGTSHTRQLADRACRKLPDHLKDYAQVLWRTRNYYLERPRDLQDPDWAFKLQCVCHLFEWLRQAGRKVA